MHEPAATLIKSAICRTTVKSVSRPYPSLFYYPGQWYDLHVDQRQIFIVYVHATRTHIQEDSRCKKFSVLWKLETKFSSYPRGFLTLEVFRSAVGLRHIKVANDFSTFKDAIQLITILSIEMSINYTMEVGLGILIFWKENDSHNSQPTVPKRSVSKSWRIFTLSSQPCTFMFRLRFLRKYLDSWRELLLASLSLVLYLVELRSLLISDHAIFD